MDRPVIAGVGGGVGTSVLAAALGLEDRGVWAGGPVDVLVCRGTLASIETAQRVIAETGTASRPSRRLRARGAAAGDGTEPARRDIGRGRRPDHRTGLATPTVGRAAAVALADSTSAAAGAPSGSQDASATSAARGRRAS